MNAIFQRCLVSSARSFALSPNQFLTFAAKSKPNNITQSVFKSSQLIDCRFSSSSNIKEKRDMSGAAEKPKIVFVLGAPGSGKYLLLLQYFDIRLFKRNKFATGKGTQCSKIVDEYNYVHLSAGDLLRAERNRPGSELAQMIEESIQAGRIIPVAVTCSLLEKAMNDQIKVGVFKNNSK